MISWKLTISKLVNKRAIKKLYLWSFAFLCDHDLNYSFTLLPPEGRNSLRFAWLWQQFQAFLIRAVEFSQISREIEFKWKIESRDILNSRFALFSTDKTHWNNQHFGRNWLFTKYEWAKDTFWIQISTQKLP